MIRMGEMIRGNTAGVATRESGLPLPAARSKPQLSMRLGHYALGFAGTEDEVREAQRLRYKVFAEEFGADICSAVPGHDIDYYDDFCDHLIVRDLDAGRVVGTYRILPPSAAQAVGEYYSEKEFSIERLAALRPQLVEVGRSCIHRDYRSGTVIGLLWQGLAAYMAEGNYRYLMGCASIGMSDGGHNAANVYRALDAQFRAPPEYSTFPLNRLPIERLGNEQDAIIPPLIKGYVRAGAWICGEPAWDPQFNCADVLVLMPMSQMGPRYARRFVNGGK